MATTTPFHHKLFFSPLPSFSINKRHHQYLLICSPKPAICASIRKPRASRKVKSNVDLCNDIYEFLSTVGLPEDHVPTTKQLSEHGRQDLANIVRRRGYKLVRELLLTCKKPIYEEGSGNDVLVEDSDLGQDGKIAGLARDVSLPYEASVVADSMNDANKDGMLKAEGQNAGSQETSLFSSMEEKVANFIQNGVLDSEEASAVVDSMNDANKDGMLKAEGQNAVSLETSVISSLEEKVANFIQNGVLDSVEDMGSETFDDRGSEQVDGFSDRQSVVETEPTTYEGRKDVIICNNSHDTEMSNGNSLPLRKDGLSTEYLTMAEEDNSIDIKHQTVENEAETNHLEFILHQKELELTHLKQQIEEEKRTLSMLQAKAEREIIEAQKLILEKDAELQAAEESLSGLKEVEIQYLADGERVELAGSFNGWHHKIKMDVQDSSIIDPAGQDIQASSSIIDPNGIRKPRLWKTVLWLYPGVYEIKFVVDDKWTTDPERESVSRGEIQNNVVRVDR